MENERTELPRAVTRTYCQNDACSKPDILEVSVRIDTDPGIYTWKRKCGNCGRVTKVTFEYSSWFEGTKLKGKVEIIDKRLV